jgi:hypothetical protein
MNEQEAILRLKQGDISGLESLVARHQLKAVRVAYLVTRQLGLAEDAAILVDDFPRLCVTF